MNNSLRIIDLFLRDHNPFINNHLLTCTELIEALPIITMFLCALVPLCPKSVLIRVNLWLKYELFYAKQTQFYQKSYDCKLWYIRGL